MKTIVIIYIASLLQKDAKCNFHWVKLYSVFFEKFDLIITDVKTQVN